MATRIARFPSQQPRALVVDDSQIARYVLSKQLARLGFEIEVAESAESALQQVAGALPDVIFMDHQLPGIDGLEAVSRLRGQTHTAEVPVVMYTSQDSESFAAHARSVGADEIYVKTDDESRLPRLLDRLALLPASVKSTAQCKSGVTVTQPPSKPGAATKPGQSLTREALARLLEPILEAQHAKLHNELLSEFAILERYQERVHKELLTRVEHVAKQFGRRVDGALTVARQDRERFGRRRGAIQTSLAAALVLGIATFLSWAATQRAEELETTVRQVAGEVGRNTGALIALQSDVGELRNVAAFAPHGSVAPTLNQRPQGLPPPAATSSSAASALVAEIQSMGILGPIRVETSAGSFCVATTPRGVEFDFGYLALDDCGTLPLQLTAVNRTP